MSDILLFIFATIGMWYTAFWFFKLLLNFFNIISNYKKMKEQLECNHRFAKGLKGENYCIKCNYVEVNNERNTK